MAKQLTLGVQIYKYIKSLCYLFIFHSCYYISVLQNQQGYSIQNITLSLFTYMEHIGNISEEAMLCLVR